jgi:hypothetical protein
MAAIHAREGASLRFDETAIPQIGARQSKSPSIGPRAALAAPAGVALPVKYSRRYLLLFARAGLPGDRQPGGNSKAQHRSRLAERSSSLCSKVLSR